MVCTVHSCPRRVWSSLQLATSKSVVADHVCADLVGDRQAEGFPSPGVATARSLAFQDGLLGDISHPHPVQRIDAKTPLTMSSEGIA